MNPLHDYQRTPVYVASRASVEDRPAMWRDLRDRVGWNVVATWIDEAGPEETKSFGELWTRIHHEIGLSHGLILYVEKDDFPLKGALVEVGMALGMRKPVSVVLSGVTIEYPHVRPIGSWIGHPLVSCHDRLEDAYFHIYRHSKELT